MTSDQPTKNKISRKWLICLILETSRPVNKNMFR